MQSDQERARVRWWWSAAAAVTLVGWVAALLTTPASALLASAVVFAAFGVLATTAVQTSRENRGRADPASAADWRRVLDHTLTGTVGAIAVLGLLEVSVAMTSVVLVGLGAGAAWAFPWRRAAASLSPAAAEPLVPADGRGAAPGTGAPAAAPEDGSVAQAPAPDVTVLTTTELVMAWRRSYTQLMRVRSPAQLAALAARRQLLLDELERRDRTGVERWLHSGARAASDPSRFLQRPAGPSATSA